MEKGLKELLENEVLSEDTKKALQEAWTNKVNEVKASLREEVASELREEFSRRFEIDKTNIIEAMDNMLTDTVRKHAMESVENIRALKEEKIRLTKAIKEARSEYKNKLANQTKVLETFVVRQLHEELKGITHDHRQIQEQRIKLAKAIKESKTIYKNKLSEHVKKLDKAILSKLSEEVTKVKAQENALANTRVRAAKELREYRTRLMIESKTKLEETKKNFISRASKVVEGYMDKQLKNEMSLLKEDIRTARENYFGRRIFEAVQAEFMTSYLNEGTEIKKISTKLTEAQSKLKEATRKLEEQKNAINLANRRVMIAEDRASRTKVLNELLSPLNREKKAVMAELLESTKTKDLKEAFQKLLPAVLEDSNGRTTSRGRQNLSESSREQRTTVITGNRENRLNESYESSENQELNLNIVELRRLAGLDK